MHWSKVGTWIFSDATRENSPTPCGQTKKTIIHFNQTGYVKDRYIGEATKSILDVRDQSEFKLGGGGGGWVEEK